MSELADTGYITATDLADYLVKNYSMSFRKAYEKTAEIVNLAEKKKKKLRELKIDELKKIEPKLTNDVLKVFNLKNSIKFPSTNFFPLRISLKKSYIYFNESFIFGMFKLF